MYKTDWALRGPGYFRQSAQAPLVASFLPLSPGAVRASDPDINRRTTPPDRTTGRFLFLQPLDRLFRTTSGGRRAGRDLLAHIATKLFTTAAISDPSIRCVKRSACATGACSPSPGVIGLTALVSPAGTPHRRFAAPER